MTATQSTSPKTTITAATLAANKAAARRSAQAHADTKSPIAAGKGGIVLQQKLTELQDTERLIEQHKLQVSKLSAISATMWEHGLIEANGMHRDALQIEIAVGLSVYASKANPNDVPLPAKKALREVYIKAGYAADKTTDEDYKTVARRLGIIATLYTFIGGRETIVDWCSEAMGGKNAGKHMLDAIIEQVKTYKFDGMNSVLAYCHKPVTQVRTRGLKETKQADSDDAKGQINTGQQDDGNAPKDNGGTPQGPQDGGGEKEMSEADKLANAAVAQGMDKINDELASRSRRQEDALPPGRIFEVGHMRVAIPMSATFDEVMGLSTKLAEFAKMHLAVGVTA